MDAYFTIDIQRHGMHGNGIKWFKGPLSIERFEDFIINTLQIQSDKKKQARSALVRAVRG